MHLTEAGLKDSVPAERLTLTFQRDRGDLGLSTIDGGIVSQVLPGSQAATRGVLVGWRLEELDGKPLDKGGGYSLKQLVTKAQAVAGGAYRLTFVLPFPQCRPPRKISQIVAEFGKLQGLSKEARLKNLENLEGLSALERSVLLRRPDAVQSLLGQRGGDELAVLLGLKTAHEIRQCHDLWSKLQKRLLPTVLEVAQADLNYADPDGNTPLHLAPTPAAAACILDGVSEKDRPALLETRNRRGETPVQAIVRRTAGTEDSSPMQALLFERVPEALFLARAEGMLIKRDEKKVWLPWKDVRKVLRTSRWEDLRRGLDALAAKLKAGNPKLNVSDYAAVWTELVYDHCFGSLETTDAPVVSPGGSGSVKGLAHTHDSRARLKDVWLGMKVLLEASFDTGRVGKDAQHVKEVTKGLLMATKGPLRSGFDPREPYRAELRGLVDSMRARTVQTLQEVFKAAKATEPDAVEQVQQFPRDALHGIDMSSAKPRLRMDSALVVQGRTVAEPLAPPPWVLGRYLDHAAWEDLRRSGSVKATTDLVNISNLGGPLVVEGMTPERVSFSRLHAAWLRGFCNERQADLAKQMVAILGLHGDALAGTMKAVGDTTVRSFRTRPEAKGLPRIVEKMFEALMEEASVPQSAALLAASTPPAQADKPVQKALRELLTPACYVCDINGAELVVDSFADLAAIYKALRSQTLDEHPFQVVRTKNGFSDEILQRDIDTKGGYRDLKLWVSVRVGATPLVTELQLHIRQFYELKEVMHLPYECSRGSFDHSHLLWLWRGEPPAPPKASRCGGACQVM